MWEKKFHHNSRIHVRFTYILGLKAVLLHNESQLPSVPVAYATDMKETYQNNEKYSTIDRLQQTSVLNIPLVKTDNIILRPLHSKLGYMKQFFKRLDKDSKAFLHLKSEFLRLTDAKIKEGMYKKFCILHEKKKIYTHFNVFIIFIGVFVGPKLKSLWLIKTFREKRAWLSFISLCENFLGNKRSANYIEVVNEFLEAYGEMRCNMSIKIHFLHFHLGFFPENLVKLSDEQGDRFHQEMSAIEKRFEGKSQVRMLPNYWCSLKRKTDDLAYTRRRSSKHF